MKAPSKPQKPSTGPPQRLVSQINHLRDLLRNLPDHIPRDLPVHKSTYHFSLDPESVEERGIFGVLSHVLEVTLGQREDGTIHFQEQGQRLEDLIKILKDAIKMMSESDRIAFESAWLNRLIHAAENDGAQHPKRKHSDIEQGSTASSSGEPAKKKSHASKSIIVNNDLDEETDLQPPNSESSPAPPATAFSSNHSSSLPSQSSCLLSPGDADPEQICTGWKSWKGEEY
ncbi:hypothetical protein VKT23_000950 [Stygiomarasmius scandens]|uniref:BAG domain-containing protein n=1 Tax=Marasmiellus scandens TaxID=2682957 RepID=A0ABR1K5M4_9AGAR